MNEVIRKLISEPALVIAPLFIENESNGNVNNNGSEKKEKRVDEAALRKKFDNITGFLKDQYQNTMTDLKISLRRSREYNAKPAFMTLSECYIDFDWKVDPSVQTEKPKLFLSSSYILPNDFKRIEDEIKFWDSTLEAQLNLLKAAFEINLNEALVNDSIKKSEEKFEKNKEFAKRLKDSELRAIQVIAIFVSIASFVLGSIKVFENKSGLQSFGIILGMASCFFLFNLFFYFVILAQNSENLNTYQKKGKKLWFIILPISFLFLSLAILWRHSTDMEDQLIGDQEKLIVHKLDSAFRNVDSLRLTKDSLSLAHYYDSIVNQHVRQLRDSFQKRHG